MAAFGPRVSRRTAFRKLKDLHARTSYSHRGGYYTLDELADFDEHGLWTFAGVRFSRAGTLVATAEAFVNHAEAGHFVDELDNLLGVGTQDALRKLVGDGRLTRHKLAGHFLYCATDHAHQTHQRRVPDTMCYHSILGSHHMANDTLQSEIERLKDPAPE